MEKIQINKNNHGVQRDYIPTDKIEIFSDNIYLYIVVKGFYRIKPGDYMEIGRSVYSEDGKTMIPIVNRRKIVLDVVFKNDNTIIKLNAEEKELLRIDNIVTEDGYYVVWFSGSTNIFAQDIVFATKSGLTPTIQYYNTNNEKYVDIVSEIYFNELNKIDGKRNYDFIVSGCQTPENFIYNYYRESDYNGCGEISPIPEKTPMYYYLPYKTNKNVLALKENLSANTGSSLYYKYNALYCQADNLIDKEEYGLENVYQCYLWKDVEDDGKRDVFNDDGSQKYNNITIAKINDFWAVSVNLTANNDYEHLFQESNITKLYTEKIKNKVISDNPIIDMEKNKFSPYYSGQNVTEITYNLHFRERDLDDNWSYIDDDDVFWNPKYSENSGLTPYGLTDASWSDMLYYLGFTDNDVKNQKAKIRKSFLRLSFYTDKDPITSQLIYYSTIFMDSGELLGKWIKAKNELLNEGKSGDNAVLNSEHSKNNRIDCRFVVKNEYNLTKSSDGFNIYYFPDEVSEISGKTIYMKVEFNHAGYGRTIPMIMWPEGGLTMDEIKNGGLYIPLELKINKDGKYVYEFEENNFIKSNGDSIAVNLVEAKLID